MKIPVILLFILFPNSAWLGRVHNEYCTEYVFKQHLIRFAKARSTVSDDFTEIVDFFPMKKVVSPNHCFDKGGDTGYFSTYDTLTHDFVNTVDVCFK